MRVWAGLRDTAVATAVSLLAVSAVAETVFEPIIVVGVARTDNLELSPAGSEVAETVYEFLPSLSLTQESTRLSSDVQYEFQAFRYADRDDSEVFHSLDAQVRAALDPENFFLEMGAQRSQTVRDPLAPIPRSNLPISGNRIDEDRLYFGPAFQYPIGENAVAAASLRRARVEYPADASDTVATIADYDEDIADVSFDNYERERGFTWALQYFGNRAEYDGYDVPYDYRRASVELGAAFGQGYRVFTAGGKESAWDNPLDPSLEDDYWEVGFVKEGAEGFSAEIAIGERSYGSSGRASIDFGSEGSRMSLMYAEEPSSRDRTPYGVPINDNDMAPPDDLLTNIYNPERYISNRFAWTWSLDLRRTNLAFGVFAEVREQRMTLDGTPLEDEEQRGSSVSVSWQLGPRTELQVSGVVSRREYESDDAQDLRAAEVSLNRQLGSRTALIFEYSRSQEEFPGASFADYTAHLFSALLSRTF